MTMTQDTHHREEPNAAPRGLAPFEDMMKLFERLSFRQRVRRVIRGLKGPRESGEYRWARLQVTRLLGPVCALLGPCLAILLLAFVTAFRPEPAPSFTVISVEPERPPEEDLVDPEPLPIVDVTLPESALDLDMDMGPPADDLVGGFGAARARSIRTITGTTSRRLSFMPAARIGTDGTGCLRPRSWSIRLLLRPPWRGLKGRRSTSATGT